MKNQQVVELKRVNVSHSATGQLIERSEFDAVEVGEITIKGKTYPQVKFMNEGQLVTTLGASGLSRAILKKDKNRLVGEMLVKDKEKVKLPTKGGFISSKDITEEVSRFEWAAERIAKGGKYFQAVIDGWTLADFARS